MTGLQWAALIVFVGSWYGLLRCSAAIGRASERRRVLGLFRQAKSLLRGDEGYAARVADATIDELENAVASGHEHAIVCDSVFVERVERELE
jgi:hypothetical protein